MTLFWKTGVALFAALASALIMAAGSASAATLAGSQLVAGQLSSLRAGAPDHVRGYTPHALQRMTQRRISRNQVEFSVMLNSVDAKRQANDTWLYRDPSGLIVIMNDNAYVVTAYWSGSNDRD